MRFRALLSLVLMFAAAFAIGDGGSIQVTMLPTITVADGRSTVTISAYVRRPSGQAVPDGTQVSFTTTLGRIRDPQLVQTVNGVARAVFEAGTAPGTAQIKVSALGVGAVTLVELELLSDRSLLSSANEYIEVVAPGYMAFGMDQRILGAAGPGHGAKLRYKEIEIEADDLQLNVPTYEVRAKKAHLRMGKVNQEFDDLYLKLTARRGVGTTTMVPKLPVAATAFGRVPWFAQTRVHLGPATIRSSGVAPLQQPLQGNEFRFEDLTDSQSLIAAKKAVVFPQKKIQFQRAEVLVGGVKILKMPLYELNLNTVSTIPTDQIFSINNNHPSINYPYFVSLEPGETTLIRFTTGQQYGRSSGVDSGMGLSLETNWNRGDSFDGGLALSNFTGRNWDLSAHQFIRFNDKSSLTGFLDMPEGRSIYSNINFNQQFDHFGISLSGSNSHTLRGNRFDSRQLNFNAEADPVKLGKQFRVSFGLNASVDDSTTSVASRSQSLMGLHMRMSIIPLKLDNTTQLNVNFTATEQTGHNSVQGLAFQGNLTLSKQFGNYGSGIISYDYLENGFNSGLTGRHQLTFTGALHQGNFGSTFSASRGLDVDKLSVFADLGYQLGNLWRLSYSYTLDRYLGSSYVDYTAALGYRIGIREVGLTYSGTTKHFGIQLLGAGFGG